ncbi:MAG: hypothetical protein ABJJ53_03060 [Sulfitobacter sp.]
MRQFSAACTPYFNNEISLVMLNLFILFTILLSGAILLWPRLANARLWRATITPLASIIGSGFLVLGPILNVNYGAAAPMVMAILCAIAYLFGHAIRYNITPLQTHPTQLAGIARVERASSAVLAFAYVISVAYYLNLFGAFGVSLTSFDTPIAARTLTSAVFLLILIVGWTKGFSALERMEQISVGIKLAIISGLLCGLIAHFGQAVSTQTLVLSPSTISGWSAATLMFGLIVTVQGFETSRYLGHSYDAPTRVRSMRLAQFVSTVIYMIYIVLLTYAFAPDTFELTETSIIDLMREVAPVLPALLVAAALSAQFSAAVADTSGSGGLIAEVSRGKVSQKASYAILVGMGLAMTWVADVFEIISYASRAFAAYYALQSAIAALSAWSVKDRKRAFLFTALSLFGLLVTCFGQSVE